MATLDDPKHSLLAMTLDAAVPLWILQYERAGGPDDEDVRRVSAYAGDIAERGDRLLFRGGKPGEAAELFNKLAEALAVLAFCPGGVPFAGRRWRANVPGVVGANSPVVRALAQMGAAFGVQLDVEPQL